jgi:hypothetical protein
MDIASCFFEAKLRRDAGGAVGAFHVFGFSFLILILLLIRILEGDEIKIKIRSKTKRGTQKSEMHSGAVDEASPA